MAWNLTMLLVHALVLSMLAVLLFNGPGWVQTLAIGLFATATAVLVYHYFALLFGLQTHWQVKLIGYTVGHVGMLLYVLRLFISDQERRCLPRSLLPPASSHR